MQKVGCLHCGGVDVLLQQAIMLLKWHAFLMLPVQK